MARVVIGTEKSTDRYVGDHVIKTWDLIGFRGGRRRMESNDIRYHVSV